tara:strand:+ start:23712 stop:23906 length:195 start_codon:yes stop_codon:yes gene_type:complete
LFAHVITVERGWDPLKCVDALTDLRTAFVPRAPNAAGTAPAFIEQMELIMFALVLKARKGLVLR